MRLIGLLIVLLVIGWLSVKQMGGGEGVPDVSVETGSGKIHAPRNDAEVDQLKGQLDNLSTGTTQRNLDYVDQASQ